MRYIAILLVLIVTGYTTSALAEKNNNNDSKIIQLCHYLNETSKDNKKEVAPAEYIPNVDIKGNPVKPADLNDNIAVLDPIIIPLEIDIAQRYGINLPLGAQMDAKIANIKIHSDGHIEFNERDISTNIEKLCTEYQKEHRQEKDNPVVSNDQIKQIHKTQDESSDKIEGQYP